MTLQFGSLVALRIDDVRYLVLHTDGSVGNVDRSAAEIHEYHRAPTWAGGRGWAGIGYHYVIRKNGEVEAGRPINRMGAHVLGLNDASLGVCCSGNGDIEDFTSHQKRSLIDLLQDLRRMSPGAIVVGHRMVVDMLVDSGALPVSLRTRKTCPGRLVDLDFIFRAIV